MTTDTNLSQIVFNRLSNEKYHELKTSGQLNDQQFYITPDLDTNPGLIQDYMSNCITKIPQHINLELSTDGTLTLKAGSKVYVPNGVGVFDEVVINSDKSYTNTNLSNMPHVAFINTAGDLKIVAEGAQTHSGTAAPTVSAIYMLWYDTTNNLVKYSTDSGTSYYDNCSLPIAVLGVSGNRMTSINQVFNGMGYIGAVAFAVPGVQVIIPNGFNSNGQLNNYTSTVERVLIKDYAADNILEQNLPLTLTNSPLLSAGDLIYVEEENQIYKGSIAELSKRTEVEIAKVTTDSTRITSLTPLPIYNRILNSTQVYETIEESLNKKITNCITKIPQDIKLELNNGNIIATDTCTVYKGDGSTYTIPASTNFTHAKSAGTFMLIWTGSTSRHQNINTCFSGNTAPVQGSFSGNVAAWYDTTNKVIKITNDGGNTWYGDNSFPLCVYTSTGSAAISINQVFNGMGYIGNTIFALPGMEGLIPNGRNPDGSLNNTKFTTTNLLTYTYPSAVSSFLIGVNNINLASDKYVYNQDENHNRNPQGIVAPRAMFATVFTDSTGRITSFNPKTTFQGVDRNELDTYDYVVEQGETNGITWEKWKSGKLIQSGSMNVTITSRITNVPAITFPKPMSDTNYKVFTGTTYNSGISNVSYNITSGLQTSGLNGNGHSGNICAVDNTAMSSGTVKIWWRIEGQGA